MSVVEIYEEVKRLWYHLGWPCRNELQCPILTQDKWEYLQHLPSIMPTHKIILQQKSEVASAGQSYAERFPTSAAGIIR